MAGWRGLQALLVGLLLVPIVTAYAIMARYAVDVPFIDDYRTLVGFAVKYTALPTASARLHYIFADQYTEYKMVLLHLLTASELAISHHVSMALEYWIGNLSLLPLLYLIWLMFARGASSLERRLLVFLPVVFYLFSLNYWEALDWAATGVAYLGTIVLSLLAIYLLAEEGGRRGWRDAAACLAALAASLISLTGFLLGPLGLAVLVRRRAWRTAWAWCGVFALALTPYLLSYTRAGANPGTGPAIWIPKYFLTFVGGGAMMVRFAVPAGVLVLVLFAIAVRTGFYANHKAAVLGAGWLLGCAAMAAIGRGRTGAEFAASPRYKIYSDLLLIFCYGFLAERLAFSRLSPRSRRWVYAGTLTLTACFCVAAQHQAATSLRERRAMLLAGVEHYRQAPAANSPMFFNVPQFDRFFADFEVQARKDVGDAEREGIYHLPDPSPAH